MTSTQLVAVELPTPSKMANLGESVHDAAETVLAVLATLDDSEQSLYDLDELHRRWGAFTKRIDARRRGGSATAQMVERRIEMAMGRLLLNMRGKTWGSLSHGDVWTCRIFARYPEVVEAVIAASTNDAPATRNRCVQAIRWHRYENGDPPTTGRRPRHTPRPDKRTPSRVREGTKLAREVSGDTSHLYAYIRKAQALIGNMNSPADRDAARAIYGALVDAEVYCVVLLRAERRSQRGAA
jgi:hypothetical protein